MNDSVNTALGICIVCLIAILWRVAIGVIYYLKRYTPNYRHGCGRFHHTYHQMELVSASITGGQDAIYRTLSNFLFFDHDYNNAAIVHTFTYKGVRYATFDTKGVLGIFSDLINPRKVPVRVRLTELDWCVHADTLGGHMLAGERRWTVISIGDHLVVATEAYERPRGWLNQLGMSFALKTQLLIWKVYLQNIAKCHADVDGINVASSNEYIDNSPWKPANG
jgi:hypothetical protein